MAAVKIEALGVCSGGERARLQVSVAGDPKATVDVEVSQVLANFTADDAQLVAITLARLVAIGKTKAQTKTALLAGVTVTF